MVFFLDTCTQPTGSGAPVWESGGTPPSCIRSSPSVEMVSTLWEGRSSPREGVCIRLLPLGSRLFDGTAASCCCAEEEACGVAGGGGTATSLASRLLVVTEPDLSPFTEGPAGRSASFERDEDARGTRSSVFPRWPNAERVPGAPHRQKSIVC